MIYTLRFFSLKCSLFHNSNVFRSCIIHILYTGVLKLKKKIRRQKVNTVAAYVRSLLVCVCVALFGSRQLTIASVGD